MLRPHRLHLVLFAQLAALGCAAPDAAPTATVVAPAPTTVGPPAPATPSTTAPAPTVAAPTPPAPTPPAPSAPTATPTATARTPSPRPKKVGDVCSNDVPCPAPLNCQLGFDGAQFYPTGTCIDGRPMYEGRPLLVDGAAHTAARVVVDAAGPATQHDDALASMLLRAAFEEHASIAAFGRTILALMQLGAPLSLIAATQQALADEIRHADAVLAAAIAHGAAPVVFGALPEATTPFADDVARALLNDVLVGGCIGETLAAFRVEARGATHPSIAALCAQIAEDEARHAALAFATARCVLQLRPDLHDVVAATFADFCSTGSVDDVACVAPAWRAAFG